MLHAFALLLVLQLVGEVIARGLALPLPGPVIGMVLLLAGLLVRERLTDAPLPAAFERTADGLLGHLSLLFVPAGVGVVLLVPTLAADGVALAAALVGSTVVTIAVTALVMRALLRPEPPADPAASGPVSGEPGR